MAEYQIAEINIAKMKGVAINDPIMKEFVDNLDSVNELAESSAGFVWRLKDDTNNATSLNPYNDEQIIVNVSVWENVESLENFVYKTFHTEFLKRRKEWFQTFGKVYTAMWWIKKGEFPTLYNAKEKLDYLQENGASEIVFDFRKKFPKPI
ncbi:DUF3291 domain-containing protein [Flavobacterium sp. WC2409]|uniref:DUF3291 domain-containing protein n=3 Tax=unclassified Flavobacterium TaxID=196869 RepID=A0AB39WCQ9_9FLAO